MDNHIDNPKLWRISRSGFSIRTGFHGDETVTIAKYPGSTMPIDSALYSAWLAEAEQICKAHNDTVPAQPAAEVADIAHAVQILRKHNEWRRGADNNHWQAAPYSPAELGRAIDTVCDSTHDIQHDVLRRATDYARSLVTWLHRDHYSDNATFEPFDDLLGLLSQIDNMICGWKEPNPAAVPEAVAKDDVAWLLEQTSSALRFSESVLGNKYIKRDWERVDRIAALLSAADDGAEVIPGTRDALDKLSIHKGDSNDE